MISSCKDCKEREVGCHSKCERYAEFIKNMKKAKLKRKADFEWVAQNWNYERRGKRGR